MLNVQIVCDTIYVSFYCSSLFLFQDITWGPNRTEYKIVFTN